MAYTVCFFRRFAGISVFASARLLSSSGEPGNRWDGKISCKIGREDHHEGWGGLSVWVWSNIIWKLFYSRKK